MTTATAEMTTSTIFQSLFRDMAELESEGVQKLAQYAKWLREEQEIAELKERFGTTPNAETIAAIKELDEGGGEITTIEEIMAELNASH
jgi:pyrroline-5-carboxylate reductase